MRQLSDTVEWACPAISIVYGTGQCHHALFDLAKKAPEKQAALKGYKAYLEHHPTGPWALPARENHDKLELGDAA